MQVGQPPQWYATRRAFTGAGLIIGAMHAAMAWSLGAFSPVGIGRSVRGISQKLTCVGVSWPLAIFPNSLGTAEGVSMKSSFA